MTRFLRLLAVLPPLVLCSRAHAAALTFDGPEACGDGAAVRSQVERLVGMSFDRIEQFDFDVHITATDEDQYRLVLRTRARLPTPSERVRELSGSSCEEVTQAAAVAIAMTVIGSDDAEPEPGESPAVQATPVDNRASPPARPRGPQAATETPHRWRFTGSAGAVFDYGALPNLGVGASVELGVGYSALRVLVLGSVFASQQARLPDGRGGEFGLSLAGALACGERTIGTLRVGVCAGGELGVLRATGLAVVATQVQSTTYQAIVAELASALEVASGISLIGRFGVTVPLARTDFLVDNKDRIHKVSSLTGRSTFGVEIAF